jgi:hypothetical protein
MIGQSLSHYEILDKLGSGGMGSFTRPGDEDLLCYIYFFAELSFCPAQPGLRI